LAKEIVDARLNAIAGGPLFSTEKGKALTSNCIASLLVKRRNSMSIAHFTSHDLRRTVATQMADLEIPENVIAKVLGHESGGKEARTLIRHYVRSGFIEVKTRALELWDLQLRCIIDRTAMPVRFLPLLEGRRAGVQSEP
jgi:integrase